MVKTNERVELNPEEKILDAAKEEFMKFGLYGARMQAIADAAGINKALLHYYFRNKENLFDKVFGNALEKYFAQMEVLDDLTMPFKKRIFQYIDNLIDFLTEYPHISIFIIKEISVSPEIFKEKMNSIRKNRGRRLYHLIESEMESGNIRKTDIQMFIMNLQSLCYYPFIASPVYKRIFAMNTKEWKEVSTVKLKKSVKEFVERTLEI